MLIRGDRVYVTSNPGPVSLDHIALLLYMFLVNC